MGNTKNRKALLKLCRKISSSDLTNHWDKFKATYGRDPRPEEECTANQLTGVDVLLRKDTAPYVDLGVWGPNHHMLQKKIRNTGPQLQIGGVLKQIEIAGPSDVHAWLEYYNLLTTALVGFGAVGLGPILDGMESRHGHSFTRLM